MEGCGRKVGPFDCCTIVCGDSRELLRQLPDGLISLCVTDPPYAIGLEYDNYKDTNTELQALIYECAPEIIRASRVSLITPGIANITRWPKAQWVMAFINPAGAFRTPWGFNCWQPILCYGKDQYLRRGHGSQRDIIQYATDRFPPSFHPAPKPPDLWKKIIRRGIGVQPRSEITRVLDPFSGSGTTAVVCAELGLHFLCFELSPTYVTKSIERLESSRSATKLFTEYGDNSLDTGTQPCKNADTEEI